MSHPPTKKPVGGAHPKKKQAACKLASPACALGHGSCSSPACERGLNIKYYLAPRTGASYNVRKLF
jgi:hypothetical protein